MNYEIGTYVSNYICIAILTYFSRSVYAYVTDIKNKLLSSL